MNPTGHSYPGLNIEPGTVIAGRYEICERVGAGGVGLVLRVLDRELNDEVVALKLLHPHLAQDETVFQRFMNEVRVARALTHPNIVRIHDIGRAKEGFSYISMEFVAGESLKEKIKRPDESDSTGKIEGFDETVAVFYQILGGVAYAHQKGVIHRDLKPANVLISSNGEVKLVDFGTARIHGMDTSITQTGQIIGTPDYMSPEQIRGEKLDECCDIYALGIIAYELVTGCRPFVADTSVAMAFKHLNEPVPEFGGPDTEIPDWYIEIVKRAMAKDKADRFQNVSEFASAILEHVPSLGQQTGIFAVDGTQFFGVPAQGVTSSGHHQAAEDGSKAADDFDLKAARKKNGGESGNYDWDFSFDRSSGGDTGKQKKYTFTDKRPKAKSKGNLLVKLLVLALVVLSGGILGIRLNEGLANWAAGELVALEQSSGSEIGWLRGVLGVQAPARFKNEDAPTQLSKAEKATRDELSRELLAPESIEEAIEATADEKAADKKTPDKKTADKKPAEQKADADPKTESSPATETTKPTAAKSAEATKTATEKKPEATAEKEQPKKVVPAKAEPAVVAAQKPKAAALKLAANLSLLERGNEARGDIVSLDKLSSYRWRATITGLGSIDEVKARSLVQNDIHLNVFDPNQARVLGRLSGKLSELSKDTKGSATIEGKLSKLRELKVAPGTYRIDFVHDGEVLASKELSFYRARANLAPSGSADSLAAGGQRVNIVRLPNQGTTVTDSQPTNANPAIERAPSLTEAVPVVGDRQPSITDPPAPSIGSTSLGGTSERLPIYQPRGVEGEATAGGSTLPPAKKPVGAETVAATPGSATPSATGAAGQSSSGSFNRSSLDMSAGELSRGPTGRTANDSYPPQVAAERKNYSGSLRLVRADGTYDDRALILNMEIRAATITGSASLAGFGQFKITGKILDRGIELVLNNEQHQIRLASGRPGGAIRGRYWMLRGERVSGRWQAKPLP